MRYSVTSTLFTADSRFVLTGSDDGNLRMWKASASEKLGIIDSRERAAMEYRDSLKERWRFDREVSKVSRCVVLVYVLFALHHASSLGCVMFPSRSTRQYS